jgi:hypothetical protein
MMPSGTIDGMLHARRTVRGVGRAALTAGLLGLGGCGAATVHPHHAAGHKSLFKGIPTVATAAGPTLEAPPGSVLVATATVPSIPI